MSYFILKYVFKNFTFHNFPIAPTFFNKHKFFQEDKFRCPSIDILR